MAKALGSYPRESEFKSLSSQCVSRTIGSPADCDSACCGFKSHLAPLLCFCSQVVMATAS